MILIINKTWCSIVWFCWAFCGTLDFCLVLFPIKLKVYGHKRSTKVLQHSLCRYIIYHVTKPSLDSPPQRSIKWSAISAQCECTIMLHYTKQQSRAMEPGACTIYFLFCLLLSACSRKTLYLRTVVIQLHRHQLGCSHHDGDRTFYFFKYQLHTFLPYLMVSCFFRFYQYLFRY